MTQQYLLLLLLFKVTFKLKSPSLTVHFNDELKSHTHDDTIRGKHFLS